MRICTHLSATLALRPPRVSLFSGSLRAFLPHERIEYTLTKFMILMLLKEERQVSLLGIGLVNHFVYSGLLVAGSGHNVLVVCGNVAAQHRRRLLGLQNFNKNIGKNKTYKNVTIQFYIY